MLACDLPGLGQGRRRVHALSGGSEGRLVGPAPGQAREPCRTSVSSI